MIDSVQTGEPAFRKAHGCGFWEYLERHLQAGALINDSSSAAASLIAAAFVQFERHPRNVWIPAAPRPRPARSS